MEGIKAVSVRIEARVSYATLGESVTSRELSHTLVVTNAKSGIYKMVSEKREAEPEPAGLAASLYASLGALQHEGRCVLVGAQHFGVARPGHSIRLSGGPDSWATMNAVVQSVELDVAAERTTVSFGPPSRLGPQDLFQLLQANRKRVLPASLPEKAVQELSPGGDSSGETPEERPRNVVGGRAPASDSAPGRDLLSKLTLSTESDGDLALDVDNNGLTLRRDQQVVATWPGDVGNYGFAVWLAEDQNNGTMRVHVKTGTAQFWGGEVKTYAEADVGAAAGGKYVYAVLNLSSGWASALSYGNMTGQNADTEVWVPIAAITGNANDGFIVTQLHWGNIVIPRTTNVVDVQVDPQEEE